MAHTDHELKLIEEYRERIAREPAHAPLAAFDGIATLLLAILEELRELNDRSEG